MTRRHSLKRFLTLAVTYALMTAYPAAASARELPAAIDARVGILTRQGDNLVDRGQFDDAVHAYKEALALLPQPVTDWKAACWPMAGIGDAYFQAKDYARAKTTLLEARHCSGAMDDPFIHFRLGQAHYELGNLDGARAELRRAYLLQGTRMFFGEDPKYLRLIKPKLKNLLGG